MNTLTLSKRFQRLWHRLIHPNRDKVDDGSIPTSFADFPPDRASRRALEQSRSGEGLKTYKSLDDFRKHLESL